MIVVLKMAELMHDDVLYAMHGYIELLFLRILTFLYENRDTAANIVNYVYTRFLGRDVAAIANPKTIRRVIEILDEETGDKDRYGLAEDMIYDRLASSVDSTGLSPKIQVLNKGNWLRFGRGIVLAPSIPFPALKSTSLIPSARA
jgi:hypothetical protein